MCEETIDLELRKADDKKAMLTEEEFDEIHRTGKDFLRETASTAEMRKELPF